MSDFAAVCKTARERGRKLLSIYITCGFPEGAWTLPLCTEIFAAGADFIELGIPFSDPIADGPVIQSAAQRSLQAGFRLNDVFVVGRAAAAHGPLLLMGYYNSVLARGAEQFLAKASAAAVQGLILPDLLLSADQEFWAAARAHGVPLIPFVTPTTQPARYAVINAVAAPFVYAVSLTGVTGARAALPADTTEYLERARDAISAPLIVGFGISSAESAIRLKPYCDGIIVGSAVIRLIESAPTLTAACAQVGALVRELRQALDA